MLFLVFSLGADRYAISGRELVEVLPLAAVKQIPHAPTGVAGLLDYHGVLLPVVDLSALALGRAAAERLSTRILIAEGEDGRRIALIAERANEMLYRDSTEFEQATVNTAEAPYLGPVTRDQIGLVQWITAAKLLSPAVRDALDTHLEQAA